MNVQEQNVQISEARKAKYPVILNVLQLLRTNKEVSDGELHPLLDKSLKEAQFYGNEAVIMFKRVLLHIGDVSRQHNLAKSLGIISSKGGAGERANFRSVMRWWEKSMPDHFYRRLSTFADFTVLENLIYDQVRTDRMKGTLKKEERMGFDRNKIAEYFAHLIKTSKNPLIARHLPNYSSGKYRYTGGKKRAKQNFTLAREKRERLFINGLCEKLNWGLKEYREYRKRQNTPEQLFSQHEIKNLSEDLVMKMFDSMTSSQRFRVSHMLTEKDNLGGLKAKEKWGKVGELYIKWENSQTNIAEKIRNTEDPEERKKVAKNLKVKATGLQTIDILSDIISGKHTDDYVNNTYQALIEKMDLVGNVFPIIDGSGSMLNSMGNPAWERWYRMPLENYDTKYSDIHLFDIAAAMCIAFSTRNPNPDFKNTFGWFSERFVVVGESKYVNVAPNRFVGGYEFKGKGDGHPIVSEKYPFIKNLHRIRSNNPGIIGSTNIGAAIEYFVSLVKQQKIAVDDLPQALLFITDNEGNTGMKPREFMTYANSVGWSPLLIFWSLKYNAMSQYKDVPNCMFIGGFNESVLSQILRGIKSGSIQPETELWSINDDKRYQIMT